MIGIILLPVMIGGLVRLGPVQDFIVGQASRWLSKELQANVQVDRLRVTYSGSILLEGFRLDDQQGHKLASFEKFVIKIGRIQRKNNNINLSHVGLYGAELHFLRTDSLNTNLDFLTEYFASDEPATREPGMDFSCDRIHIEDLQLFYRDHSVDTAPVFYSFLDLTVKASAFLYTRDTTGIRLDHLSFHSPELTDVRAMQLTAGMSQTGFHFPDISLVTAHSKLDMALHVRFDSLAVLGDPFSHHIGLNIDFREFAMVPHEFSFLADELKELEDTVFIHGKIGGDLLHPVLEDFVFDAMPYARFRGQGSIMGTDSMSGAQMSFRADHVFLDPLQGEALGKIVMGDQFSLPEQVKNLGQIQAKGVFRGTLNDFYADARFTTAAGSMVTDLSVKKNLRTDIYSYQGRLEAQGFDLAVLMGDKAFGYTGFKATVNGKGLDKYADVTMDVSIDSVWLQGRRYEDIDIRGVYEKQNFDGSVNIFTRDVMLSAAGSADFSGSVPSYTASINIPHVDLKGIGIVSDEHEDSPVFSSLIMAQVDGNNPDDMYGWVSMNNTRWEIQDSDLQMSSLIVEVNGAEEGLKQISLESDFFDMDVTGQFRFQNLQADIRHVLEPELPALAEEMEDGEEMQDHITRGHYLDFHIRLKNTDLFTQTFMPGLQLAQETYLKGQINVDQQKVFLDGKAKYINMGIFAIRDITISDIPDRRMGVSLGAHRIQVSDTIGIDRFMVTAQALKNNILFQVNWDDHIPEDRNKGDLSGSYSLEQWPLQVITINPSSFSVNDTLWQITEEATFELDSAWVAVKDFNLKTRSQGVSINGALSPSAENPLVVSFDQLNIANVDPFANPRKIDFEGLISGQVSVGQFFSPAPDVTSDLIIDSLGFNGEHLGDAFIRSGWVDSLQALFAEVEVKYQGNIGVSYPLKVDGHFYPFDDQKNFDFHIHLENYKLQTIAGYLSSFTSYFRGLASGQLQFKGTLANPWLEGEVRLMRTVMHVDYLNTTYSLADKVRLTPTEFIFDQIQVNDNNSTATRGNQAILDGKITHKNFRDFHLDLTVDADRFTVLNTPYTPEEFFYGSAVATGRVRIHGPDNDVTMDVNVRTERGTRLFIPVTNTAGPSKRDFITFVSPDDTVETISFDYQRRENIRGLQLNVLLEVTPNAEVQIIFDEAVGDIITAKGSGEIELGIDTRGEFSMYGSYRVHEGDYLFTLDNIIDRRFLIREGGRITWDRDPMDANLDLRAYYPVSARLYDLVSHLDTSQVYKRSRPVHCVLRLEGGMMNPEITPHIFVPNADEMTQQLVNTVLYVSPGEPNQQEMNRQFVGLLVLNSFFPPAAATGDDMGGGVEYAGMGLASSTEIISNQLSGWLSQISDDFNIGVNYRPGDEISSEEVEIALSTQLFDDRMRVNTNVGVGGNTMEQQTAQKQEKATQIVGDVNIEYDLTERLRIRAFNRHNDYSYLAERGPYTQGLGFFYRNDFYSIRELFGRKEKQNNDLQEEDNKEEDNQEETNQEEDNKEEDNQEETNQEEDNKEEVNQE